MLRSVDLLAQPVALIAWALLAVVVASWRSRARGSVRWSATALTAFYFAVATPLGANLAVGALERGATAEALACSTPDPEWPVVVLAGGVSADAASADDVAALHAASFRRLVEGVRLARATAHGPLVLSGGSGAATREADLMASLARSLGVPPERLLLERESKTTAEAARNVARLLKTRGLAPAVYLVTSAMHVRRAAATFRRQGVSVCPVPVDRRWVRPEANEAWIPQITALDKSTLAYHELVGHVLYWVSGRL